MDNREKTYIYNKRIVLAVLALVAFVATAGAQQDTLKYRLMLTDKAATTYSPDRPEEFLSAKAIARRKKQQLAIDSTDLPVCQAYIEAIRRQGARIVTIGKWENFVTVSFSDTTLRTGLLNLPFVRSIERVWTGSREPAPKPLRQKLVNKPTQYKDSIYGPATAQIAMSNGHLLHRAGFRGEGMTIAVIDAGFHNADKIKAMKGIRILGTRDFVNPKGDVYAENRHGLKVLSCIAMNRPGVMTGTAPEASFWLLRTEDEYSENLVEQDYWAAAVEFADSVGVDIINTSLGYYAFDDPTKNYELRHLDGRHSLMSRQASRLADKGIVLVCSAGNSGSQPWKKITPPADAENVLTVGAIDTQGLLADFSSVGNTADGRIKPDVVAVGYQTAIIRTDGNQGHSNGTSFAAPVVCGLVACLWQALPQLSAKEVIELVRRSGDRAEYPDNIYGYGIPDVWKAYQWRVEN